MTATAAAPPLSHLRPICPAHGKVTINWSSAWYGDRIAAVTLSCGCTVTDEDPEE